MLLFSRVNTEVFFAAVSFGDSPRCVSCNGKRIMSGQATLDGTVSFDGQLFVNLIKTFCNLYLF